MRERLSELTAERERKLAKLGGLLDQLGRGSDDDDPGVLDDLPIARLDDLSDAPEAVLRRIFDALRLRLVYDGRTGTADVTVTVTDDTLTAVWGAIGALSDAAGAGGPADGLETNGATGAQGRLFPSVVRPRHARSPIRTAPGPQSDGDDRVDVRDPTVETPREVLMESRAGERTHTNGAAGAAGC